jgi:hypothetical protein
MPSYLVRLEVTLLAGGVVSDASGSYVSWGIGAGFLIAEEPYSESLLSLPSVAFKSILNTC